jgi:hypothetical protein
MGVIPRSVLISGDRYGEDQISYAFTATDPGGDAIEVASVPLVERPLRIARLPLLAPFGRTPGPDFRELTVVDPRISRLWGRFSVDVGVARERDAGFFAKAVFADGRHRVFIIEDGDRYALRAMCAFRMSDDHAGEVVELLHDRTVTGLRAASRVLGLALRAMYDEGAVAVRAWSFTHSGSFPIYLRHAFIPRKSALALRVRTSDPMLAEFVSDRRHWYVSLLDES